MGCKIHRKLKLRNILASTVASLSTFFDKLYAPLSAGSHHTRAAIMPRINEEGVSTPCRITLKSGESAHAPASTSAARIRQVSGALAASLPYVYPTIRTASIQLLSIIQTNPFFPRTAVS
jgi:hypothetical protein